LKYYKTDGIGEPPRMMGVKPPGWASLTAELREPQPWVLDLNVIMCDTTNCTKAIDVAPPTVIHSFGSDNSDHLYVIGPGGLWRLVSPQLCDQTPPPSAPPSPLPIQVPVPAPVAQPQPAPIVPARSVFKNPKMYCPDENGNLKISLTVKTQTWKTNVFEFQTRSYDGEFPGPSIIVAPGSMLKIKIINQLEPTVYDAATSHNDQHPEINATNLHLHGLHVSPSGKGDNVLDLVAKPGETLEQFFQIPTDHHSGTFWYHPHVHGSGALQVEGGMAGALIILDQKADHPALPIRDNIMMFQHVGFRGEPHSHYQDLSEYFHSHLPTQIRNFGGNDRYVLVNGLYQPLIQMKLGETIRVRFINAGQFAFVNPTVPNTCEMHVIALDGVYVTKSFQTPRVILPSGARADVFIKCNSLTLDQVYHDVTSTSNGVMLSNALIYEGILFSLDVAEPNEREPPFSVPLPYISPDKFGDIRLEPVNPEDKRTIEFNGFLNTVNSKPFNRTTPLFKMELGSTQEWTLLSIGDSRNHPYHQHMNAFQVLSFPQSQHPYSNTGLIPGSWRDTIPLSDMGDVVIRWRAFNFSGLVLFHCHVIAHSDMGMMGMALVEGDENIYPHPLPQIVSKSFCKIDRPDPNLPAPVDFMNILRFTVFISFIFVVIASGIAFWVYYRRDAPAVNVNEHQFDESSTSGAEEASSGDTDPNQPLDHSSDGSTD